MPEVIFPGPDGRLEGRYHPQKNKDAPIAIILHPHPLYGGTMNNKVVYNLHYTFHRIGFTCLRFNFRGVGRSQGEYDQGIGELSDAAAALDYLQALNANAKNCWVAGFSFGAWIGMQLLMRRPEEGQGARKEKSYWFAGGATETKPAISGRRISSCMPIQAPKEKPATQQERAFGLSACR